MKVLITGAGGFIGSHLAEHYIRLGMPVLGLDNFLTGRKANLQFMDNAAESLVIEADVSDADAVDRACQAWQHSPDTILHFASPASPVDYATYPIETLRVNSLGTENACALALRHAARLVFASTSEAYGDPLQHPQREEYWGNVNPNGLRSCYDEAKRYGEAMVMAYVRKFSLDARIVRIFNTYGPRMRRNDGRVVPNFVTQALALKPLAVYGDGSQTRSFCYVDDLVEGIIRVAEVNEARAEVINLGNPEEYTIREFAAIVATIAGVPLEITHEQIPADDPTRRCPDTTKAKRLLGWEPRVGILEGLTRTIEWFRKHPDGASPRV